MARKKHTSDDMTQCPKCGVIMDEYGRMLACPNCGYIDDEYDEGPPFEDWSDLEDAT
jgi:ribosomal protein S27AE